MRHQLTSALLAGICALAIGTAGSAMAADQGTAANSRTIQESALEKEKPKPQPLALSDQQRQAILNGVAQRHSHQATPKEFKPEPGAAVVQGVDLHGFPPELVAEVPALKQYMYAHLDREIAIVDAVDKKVAEVIPLPDNLVQTKHIDQKKAAVSAVGGFPDLSDEQKRAIYQAAGAQAQPVPPAPMLAGAEIPGNLTLQPLPPQVGAQIPQAQSLQFAKLQDGRVLLVDPQKRTIAGIITQDEGKQTAQDSKGGASETLGASGEKMRDPLREREETGKDSAYTGPGSRGPNSDK